MRKERKHYTAEEKVAILRRHLLDKVPVSDLCEELGLLFGGEWVNAFAFCLQDRLGSQVGIQEQIVNETLRRVFEILAQVLSLGKCALRDAMFADDVLPPTVSVGQKTLTRIFQ